MKEEDFDFGFGEKLEDNDLDLEFEDEFDDDGLEELPREGTPLYSVMTANGILTLEDRKGYHQYTPDNLGCCMENSILIEETEDYVGLEYEILEYLLRSVPYRFVDYELEKQRLIGAILKLSEKEQTLLSELAKAKAEQTRIALQVAYKNLNKGK